MDRILAIDIDGVILDHPKGMAEWARSIGVRVACEAHELSAYDMSPMFPDLSAKQIRNLIEEFSRHKHFGDLPVIPGSEEALDYLRSNVKGLKIVAITAPGTNEVTALNRKRNLARFKLDGVVMLPLGHSKFGELSKLATGTVYIDDLLEHVATAEALGHHAFLFRHSYNRQDHHHRVINDWPSAVDPILELLQ